MSKRPKILKKNENFIPEARIYCDGASSGNPGHAGTGIIIRILKGRVPKVHKISEYIGIATNNVAEYSALIRGLEEARSLGLKNIEVLLDSELLVNQINGTYKIKNLNLRPLWKRSKEILSQFDNYRVKYVKRQLNKEADSLARGSIKRYVNRGD
jgi:ribonuclease HI